MSKQGSLNRIKKYRANGNEQMALDEEKFYNENYGEAEKPVVEKKPKK